MSMIKSLSALLLGLSLVLTLPAMAQSEAESSASAVDTGALVQSLVSELGISTEQASGGAGALLNMAQQMLPEGDWSALLQYMPEATELIKQMSVGSEGGILDKILALFGGGEGGMLDAASVLNQVKDLNLDASMLSQFVPVILGYLENQGGGALVEQLRQLWQF